MTMHGLFWHFPKAFTSGNSADIHPRSAYLKVIGDFTRWNDRLVFGCDDSAQKEFLNKRKAKGAIEGPGQSNSNLWFTSLSKPDELGPSSAEGAVWAKENIRAGEYSEPFLFSGWDYRSCWIWNGGKQPVSYAFEIDRDGKGEWQELKTIAVPAGKSVFVSFNAMEKGEWIRVRTNKDTHTTVSFNYSQTDGRSQEPAEMFAGLSSVENPDKPGGLLYGLGDNRRTLGVLANKTSNGKTQETGYYEMSDKLELIKKEDPETADFIRKQFAIPQQAVTIEESSVLIIDDQNRRWRLPLGNKAFRLLTDRGSLRICREVATERDLFHCMGTFYELPAENADGYAKIRPVATHNYRINDYASYRGMLILTGVEPEKGKENPHLIVSADGKAAVWAGVIDDLWQLGKPVGHGGPWKESKVMKGVPSDPYLFAFYDKKELSLSHKSEKSITFTMEFDPTGNGDWMSYHSITVQPGETARYTFPRGMEARWIRLVSDWDTQATALLEYN
jgi:hypothetical protein